jgi:putative transposase
VGRDAISPIIYFQRKEQDIIPLHTKMSNLRFREFYRRRLPHIQVAGSTYFVTFRLKNSLPKNVLEKLAEESARIKDLPLNKIDSAYHDWFGKYDEYLDQVLCGEEFLKNEQIADLVAESIHYRDGNIYDLVAFCIMPNHVHLVFMPLEKAKDVFYSLSEILQSLKRHTARQSNLILGRSGAFWQDESYDHIVRDEAELERIAKYIINNPVKAGLVDGPTKWKWTYCKYSL